MESGFSLISIWRIYNESGRKHEDFLRNINDAQWGVVERREHLMVVILPLTLSHRFGPVIDLKSPMKRTVW